MELKCPHCRQKISRCKCGDFKPNAFSPTAKTKEEPYIQEAKLHRFTTDSLLTIRLIDIGEKFCVLDDFDEWVARYYNDWTLLQVIMSNGTIYTF